jgi:acetyl esterase/lipase
MGRWVGGIRLQVAAVALLAAGGVAGCALPPPPGTVPLRYRDVIFPNVTTTPGLSYGSALDAPGKPVTLTLDMYQPTGDAQSKRPAVVWVHGGGLTMGSSTNANMVTMATEFAERGYVAVSINYRLLGNAPCAASGSPPLDCSKPAVAAQHDAQAAVRWLRANAARYRIDPTRIAVGGSSSGATTSLRVGADSQDVGSSGNPGYPSTVNAVISISGGMAKNDLFGAGDAPTLFFNGTADPLVPYEWAVQNAAALNNAHVPAILELLPGAGHVPFATDGPLMITQSVYFAYDFLDVAHAAGQPSAAAKAFDQQAAKMLTLHPTYKAINHLAESAAASPLTRAWAPCCRAK